MSVRGSRTSAARQGPFGPLAAFLERFRRTRGVPATIGDDRISELAPLFAALDRIEQDAASLRSRSQAARARLAHETDEEIERILAEARGCGRRTPRRRRS
jgi:hypothetical protein